MQRNPKKVSAGGVIVSVFVFLNAIVLEKSYLNANWPDLAYVTLPLLLMSIVAFRLRLI